MFEAAEIGHRLAKDKYKQREPELRAQMITLQYELRKKNYSVLVLVMGDDRPGCDDVINLLNEWFDPRFVQTHAFMEPSDEERERPRLWRYWRALPPHGQIGIFAGAWAWRTIAHRLRGQTDEAQFQRQVEHVRRFEQLLVDNQTVLIKLWLHLPKKELKRRLKEAEEHPDIEWRLMPEDREVHRHYDQAIQVVESFVRQTSTGDAPWHLIESTDERYRNVAVAELLLDAIPRRISAAEAQAAAEASLQDDEDEALEQVDPHTVLDTVDLSCELSKDQYQERLSEQQARLNRLAREAHQRGLSAVWMFEGWDAAGKGGCIRRLAQAMNAQMYRIVPIAAPTPEELRYHYLWRFWRHLPRAGRVLIFDRSWYGRVLVERVEGFATDRAWQRAYGEINDFEEQLLESGIVLAKFWLHIDSDEQLRRFKEREQIPYKKFKITEDDYRNRERRPQYEAAVNEMVARTSTREAPWHLIPANVKRHARVEVLKMVCEKFEAALGKSDEG